MGSSSKSLTKLLINKMTDGFVALEKTDTNVQFVKMNKTQFNILEKAGEIENGQLWKARVVLNERNLNPVMINKRYNTKAVFNRQHNKWYVTKRS